MNTAGEGEGETNGEGSIKTHTHTHTQSGVSWTAGEKMLRKLGPQTGTL